VRRKNVIEHELVFLVFRPIDVGQEHLFGLDPRREFGSFKLNRECGRGRAD